MPESPPALLPELPPPLLDPRTVQWIEDVEHLRLLSIFHYIFGGLAILFSAIFIIYIVFGLVIVTHPAAFDSPGYPAPANHVVSVPPIAPPAGSPGPSPFRVRTSGSQPPAFFGYMLMGLGSFAVLLGCTIGALLISSGRNLAQRRRRTFSMVVAGLSCLQVPFGTILGVFTLVVLSRPSVLALYAPGRQKRLGPV